MAAHRHFGGGVSATTANKELARKHLLARAVEWKYLKASPSFGVRKAKEPDGRMRYLTEGECQSLLDGANDRLRLSIAVALQTGARRTELMRLARADVNMTTRMVTFKKAKNGRDRSVPMTDTLRANTKRGV